MDKGLACHQQEGAVQCCDTSEKSSLPTVTLSANSGLFRCYTYPECQGA